MLTKVQRCTSTQEHKYTHISGKLVAYKSTQVHKYTGVHKYTPMSGKQVDYKSTQVHKYKGTQVQMCISTQVHKNTPIKGNHITIHIYVRRTSIKAV